jgi:C4-type Zn-finger protein
MIGVCKYCPRKETRPPFKDARTITIVCCVCAQKNKKTAQEEARKPARVFMAMRVTSRVGTG